MNIEVTDKELRAIGFDPAAWGLTDLKTRARLASTALRLRGDSVSAAKAQLLETNNSNAMSNLSMVWTGP